MSTAPIVLRDSLRESPETFAGKLLVGLSQMGPLAHLDVVACQGLGSYRLGLDHNLGQSSEGVDQERWAVSSVSELVLS